MTVTYQNNLKFTVKRRERCVCVVFVSKKLKCLFSVKIVASKDQAANSSVNELTDKARQMCLVENRGSKLSLNMTLAARMIPQQNACVEVSVPYNSWSSGVACCPNCRHELRVSLTACKPHVTSHSPLSPFPQPTYLPHTPLYTIPTSPYNDELRRLADTLKALRLSGWYYGNLDRESAQSLLKDASVGAFVIRDSGDRNFIFALTIQTEKGPTSVRLHYEQGYFRLDSDVPLAKCMPRFRCVVELAEHYTRVGGRSSTSTVWVDREGCPHSPVLLKTPLRKCPPSLLHSARISVHRALNSNPLKPKLWLAPKHRHLPLPSTLIDYLGEYPYSI